MAVLHLIYGPQGAGKSTHARRLARQHGALLLSIDDWMAALFVPDMPRPPDFGWIAPRVRRCENRIWHTAAEAARAGCASVLDLGFMSADSRKDFTRRGAAEGLALRWYFVDAPLALRRERVAARNAARGETFAFDVTPAMFDFMERRFEAPGPDERARATLYTADLT